MRDARRARRTWPNVPYAHCVSRIAHAKSRPVLRSRPIRRRRLRAVLVRSQVPVEESPDSVPRVDLLGGIVALEGARIDAAVEGVADAPAPAGWIHIDLGLGE